MIQRWHIADNDDPEKNGRPKSKQMLVVTRLPPGAVCHVAYIDVTANPQANELARKAADELARGFDCKHGQGQRDRHRRPRHGTGDDIAQYPGPAK